MRTLIVLLVLFALLVWRNCRKLGTRSYLIRVLVAFDQFANVVLFAGMPDETISSRCARGQRFWYWRLLGGVLDAVDKDHVRDALASELTGAHRPPC